MTDAAIDIQNLSKAFAKRPAVIDLSLQVPKGSIYGLLGHNGAGKSTTLGMLLGQVYPDAGRVSIHGCDVFADRAGALSKVGAIFESPCFYDYLSGRRNLEMFCGLTAKPDRRRMAEVIERVRLTERIDDRVLTYSHGMRQRLALAQALLPGPDTLILDEPTDGVDPQGIAEFRATLRQLNRELGMTILFSSHLLSEVEQLCERVAVLDHGKRVFEGRWEDAATGGTWLELETDRQDDAVAALREAGMLEDETMTDGRLRLSTGVEPAVVNRWLMERGFSVSRIGEARLSLEDFYLLTVGGERVVSDAVK